MKLTTKLTLTAAALLLTLTAAIYSTLVYQAAKRNIEQTDTHISLHLAQIRHSLPAEVLLNATNNPEKFMHRAFHTGDFTFSRSGSLPLATVLVEETGDGQPGKLLYCEHILLQFQPEDSVVNTPWNLRGLVLDDYTPTDLLRIQTLIENDWIDQTNSLKITAAGHWENNLFYPSQLTVNGETFTPENTSFETETETLSLSFTGWLSQEVRLNHPAHSEAAFANWKHLLKRMDTETLCKTFALPRRQSRTATLLEYSQQASDTFSDGSQTVHLFAFSLTRPLHSAMLEQLQNLRLLLVLDLVLLYLFHQLAKYLVLMHPEAKRL